MKRKAWWKNFIAIVIYCIPVVFLSLLVNNELNLLQSIIGSLIIAPFFALFCIIGIIAIAKALSLLFGIFFWIEKRRNSIRLKKSLSRGIRRK